MELRLVDSQDMIRQYCERYADTSTIRLMGPENFPVVGGESEQEPVIFVDGGTKYRRDKEGLSVGDGDSWAGGGPIEHKALDVLLPQAKNYSDFAFVLKSLTPNFKHIQTFGFMGGRTDHQLINFGEAHHFLRLRDDTTLIFDHEAWGFSAGVWRPRIQGIFSILNLEACEIRVEGLCDYQIKELTKLPPMTSRGLSNVGHGQIEIESTAPIFVLTERRLHIDSSGSSHNESFEI